MTVLFKIKQKERRSLPFVPALDTDRISHNNKGNPDWYTRMPIR